MVRDDDRDSNLSQELSASNYLKGLNYNKIPVLIDKRVFRNNAPEDLQNNGNENKDFSQSESKKQDEKICDKSNLNKDQDEI